MNEGLRITFTADAADEIRALGGQAKARIEDRIRHLRHVGWQEAMRLRLVKELGTIKKGIYEIIIKGKGPAYRVLCFPTGDDLGRLVVVTTCEKKSNLLGNGKLKKHVERAADRRDTWLRNREERP